MARVGARAFVPGHVTGFFSPARHEEPARSGSRGAGLTLSDGVTVTVEPASETAIVLNDVSTAMDPVTAVLDELGVTATVTAETDLPVGAGFGVSGAAALGTALAANDVFDLARSENALVTIAHCAEVEADTGLGDVVAQARGGIPIRLDPGAPGHGRLDGIPDSTDVEYVSFDTVDTAEIIGGETQAIEEAGDAALRQLVTRPTLETLMAASRSFADDAELLVPAVAEAIEAVNDEGGSAAMAMLGETVVALDSGLSDAGFDACQCRTHPAGATITD